MSGHNIFWDSFWGFPDARKFTFGQIPFPPPPPCNYAQVADFDKVNRLSHPTLHPVFRPGTSAFYLSYPTSAILCHLSHETYIIPFSICDAPVRLQGKRIVEEQEGVIQSPYLARVGLRLWRSIDRGGGHGGCGNLFWGY